MLFFLLKKISSRYDIRLCLHVTTIYTTNQSGYSDLHCSQRMPMAIYLRSKF